MNFWKHAIKFHKFAHTDHENGKKGLAAVKYLRNVFEKFTYHSLSHQHPIGTRLLRASVKDYEWLIQYAQKMRFLKSINESEEIFSRLSKLDEVYQAWAEAEVVLKLKFAGIDVSFVKRTHAVQTPDILVTHDSFDFNIEVTTLNSPEINIHLNDFYFKIFHTLLKHRSIKFGGSIARTLKEEEIEVFLQSLEKKAEEALVKNQLVVVNEPGYVTIHIAPKQFQDKKPENVLNGFRFDPKKPKSAEEAIINKIYNKKNQLFHRDQPGILVVYCGTRCWEPETLFKDVGSNIDVILNTFPDLMGIVLTNHQRWWKSIESPVTQILKHKTLIEQVPAIQEYEATIIWENTQAKNRFPPEIVQAFINYQQNLNNL